MPYEGLGGDDPSLAESAGMCLVSAARSKDTYTVGSQLVGNVTLPSTPICESV
jgi:hypothetical protein